MEFKTQYNCNLSLCSLQNSLISKTNDGSFWYSEIGMVLWFREAFDKLWYPVQSMQNPWSHSQKLPSFVLEIREFCNEHNERLQLYCKEHGCPCCRICIVENHSECKGSCIHSVLSVSHLKIPSMHLFVW
jgi:hypothetical protein